MGEVKNLRDTAGIEKLQTLVKNEVCLFCTFEDNDKLETRPMSVRDVDDEGNLWFISRDDSEKNQEVSDNRKVQILYSNPGNQTYCSIEGQATILRDRTKTDEVWTPIAKAWFKEGKDDPALTLIKVTPDEAYYWDTKDGKMISFLKILTAAVTGRSMDGGREGSIKL